MAELSLMAWAVMEVASSASWGGCAPDGIGEAS